MAETMQNETSSHEVTLIICGGTYMLDTWELMRWIVQKTLQGQKLYCKGTWASSPFSGQLLPHSIDRTQRELTRCPYVDVLTDKGTYTTHCENLTYIRMEESWRNAEKRAEEDREVSDD